MSVGYAILVVIAAGVLTEFITALVAPMGYQDESGFHLGPGADGLAHQDPPSGTRH